MTIDCTRDVPVLCNVLFHSMEKKYMKEEESCSISFPMNSSSGEQHVFACICV